MDDAQLWHRGEHVGKTVRDIKVQYRKLDVRRRVSDDLDPCWQWLQIIAPPLIDCENLQRFLLPGWISLLAG